MNKTVQALKDAFDNDVDVNYNSSDLLLVVMGSYNSLTFKEFTKIQEIMGEKMNIEKSYFRSPSIFIKLNSPLSMSKIVYAQVPLNASKELIRSTLRKPLPTFELEGDELSWLNNHGISANFIASDFENEFVLYEDQKHPGLGHLIGYRPIL